MTTTLMIILLVLGVFLTIAVLLQHGKSHGLGTITGSAETFLGKEKGSKLDRILARLTTVIGILFVLVVLVVYILQPTYSLSSKHQSLWQSNGLSEYYGAQGQDWVDLPQDDTTAAETEGTTAEGTEAAT